MNEKRIALLAAIRSEVSGWLGHLSVENRWVMEGFTGWEGVFGPQKILLIQTGIGKDRAERAATLACEKYSLSGLISFGFGGSLTDRLKVGDLILCRSLLSSDPSETALQVESDPAFLEAGLSLRMDGFPALPGICISVEKLITDPVEKRLLGQQYVADVVDMESYWVGKASQDRGIPFLAIRAISDTVDRRLPDLGDLNSLPGHMVRKAAGFIFAHPRELPGALTSLRDLRLAQRGLTQFLDSFLDKENPERSGR
jgi:adenosylhomocysteine nucleosidase